MILLRERARANCQVVRTLLETRVVPYGVLLFPWAINER